jgi:hypothetical protein
MGFAGGERLALHLSVAMPFMAMPEDRQTEF